jgi:hypothetical protein
MAANCLSLIMQFLTPEIVAHHFLARSKRSRAKLVAFAA